MSAPFELLVHPLPRCRMSTELLDIASFEERQSNIVRWLKGVLKRDFPGSATDKDFVAAVIRTIPDIFRVGGVDAPTDDDLQGFFGALLLSFLKHVEFEEVLVLAAADALVADEAPERAPLRLRMYVGAGLAAASIGQRRARFTAAERGGPTGIKLDGCGGDSEGGERMAVSPWH